MNTRQSKPLYVSRASLRATIPGLLAAATLSTSVAHAGLTLGSIGLDDRTIQPEQDVQPEPAQPKLAQPEPVQAEQPENPPAAAEPFHTSTHDAFTPARRPWTVRILPTLWYTGPSGKLTLPVTSGNGPGSVTSVGTDVDIDDLGLDKTRLRPAGEAQIASGHWRFTFSGTQFELSDHNATAPAGFQLGAVSIAAGDQVRSNFEFGAYELTAGYRVWDRDFSAGTGGARTNLPVTAELYLFAGARAYDLSMSVERTSAGTGPSLASYDELLIEPLIGGRAEVAFDNAFGIEVLTSFGYLPCSEQSTISFDIAAGFFWRPTEHLGLLLGYRQLAFDIEDGEDLGKFRYDGRLAGLYTGLEIGF